MPQSAHRGRKPIVRSPHRAVPAIGSRPFFYAPSHARNFRPSTARRCSQNSGELIRSRCSSVNCCNRSRHSSSGGSSMAIPPGRDSNSRIPSSRTDADPLSTTTAASAVREPPSTAARTPNSTRRRPTDMGQRCSVVDHHFKILSDIFTSRLMRQSAEPIQKPTHGSHIVLDGALSEKANLQLAMTHAQKFFCI